MNIHLSDRAKEHVLVFWNKTQEPEIKHLIPLKSVTIEDALKQYDETQQVRSSSYGKVIYVNDIYI